VGDQAQTTVTFGSGPDYQICIPLGWAPWVRVICSGQTQIDYTEESKVSVPVTFQQRSASLWIPMPAALRVLVLVPAHPKLRSFIQLCAWFILSLGPKPPLAHYQAIVVCLATTSLKK
jgi:hypothetical protein